eukprot:Nitzschia sp. Nitz4//scaffold403_size10707//3459//5456//NITZ4_009062-RA/size10707-processed-gene-0.7-mRNA-1//-1//CDS//3329551083//2978//frame0
MVFPTRVALILYWLLISLSLVTAQSEYEAPPNIVFLVVESTDGRTWQEGYQDDVVPLPNLRHLQAKGGTSFYSHYCNSPVCCPSRASFWSGRHPHKIPHQQATPPGDNSSFPVDGVWNNFEGLPPHYADKIGDVLGRNGYQVFSSGKQDFTTGSHTLTTRINSWTMYTRFPYNLTEHHTWSQEDAVCRNNGTVLPDNEATPPQTHLSDWVQLNHTLDWMQSHVQQQRNSNASPAKPFFVYQGMDIVHPPYVTNQYWYSRINASKIRVPAWPDWSKQHPCDLQSSMLKGCLPTDNDDAEWVQSDERRRHIRRIYYAMIAEFDAMVGRYMEMIHSLGIANNTVFVVTSDHGDMQMERAQFYKMSPYDASTRVPLIIYDPRRPSHQRPASSIIDTPTQHVDLFPTILDLAGLYGTEKGTTEGSSRLMLDGTSLVPYLDAATEARFENDNSRNRPLSTFVPSANHTPPYVVSQYHGDDSPMSWFLIVESHPCVNQELRSETLEMDNPTASTSTLSTSAMSRSLNKETHEATRNCTYKLIVWGTGQEVPTQLFDLTNDPDEMDNLFEDTRYLHIVEKMDDHLNQIVDYRSVATTVAQYNVESFQHWQRQNPSNWTKILSDDLGMRWHHSWKEQGSNRSLAAIAEWLSQQPPPVLGCRREVAWPPNEIRTD